ncbi:lipoprotein [Nocardioides psychrotolerans]|uniref:DUF305 domain-containing protein n=1 Tax=Nocardioides psychrotolerans TaxID=1005945 RepID=UPI0011950588|nr:DUF305 domain-containing protein [Nocardioides psychrotolerans]GEP38123.1 lipoprotein [Nocardioides psychrotolerans]
MFTLVASRKLAVAFATAATLALSLTACGGDDPADDPSAVQTAENGDVFNGADVAFASDMIPHHTQAIEMVDLTEGRTLDPEVQQIADAIRNAQAPEIETMSGWLTSWGEEVPETSEGGHDMSDMGGDSDADMGSMSGMMTSEDMAGLANASDAEFQDMWLSMMVEHHTGAVEMAEAEQADGEFADAVALAEQIESSQTEEIATMKDLLSS